MGKNCAVVNQIKCVTQCIQIFHVIDKHLNSTERSPPIVPSIFSPKCYEKDAVILCYNEAKLSLRRPS
ncbi:hypothetical protein GCM10011351_26550 [Paraliobacillus quinghaiensis]|uniref:Uncharacterized protein n=1 Tax=Paraliobacillus quinghaiensis TaxID=470815 RepID=A0A917TVA8_9BACI|nr:hypothetical protein GCM10011351_26550 [Paraliobacillus quinghaiensis]